MAKNTQKVFHYAVYEVGRGTENADGVELSDGYINITLTVRNVENKLQYYVKSTTYLGNQTIYKENKSDTSEAGIRMSGIEFSLGAFFVFVKKALYFFCAFCTFK